MTSWVRLWHDMPTDPKFRTIARAAKQPLPTVVAVFTFLLADASANENERGRTTATDEDIASAFDVEESDVVAIKKAMQGRVLDGDMLAGWEKRQPKKEDNSAERAKAWRAKKQAENESERPRTEANAEERPDAEADKNQKKKEPPQPPSGERAAELWVRLQEAYPRSRNTKLDRAEKLFLRLSQADQELAVEQARPFEIQMRTEAGSRGRPSWDQEKFTPGLDSWLRDGRFRSAAPSKPAVTLPVLREGDPLVPIIEKIRGKPVIFGTKGTITITPAELEQARAAA